MLEDLEYYLAPTLYSVINDIKQRYALNMSDTVESEIAQWRAAHDRIEQQLWDTEAQHIAIVGGVL